MVQPKIFSKLQPPSHLLLVYRKLSFKAFYNFNLVQKSLFWTVLTMHWTPAAICHSFVAHVMWCYDYFPGQCREFNPSYLRAVRAAYSLTVFAWAWTLATYWECARNLSCFWEFPKILISVFTTTRCFHTCVGWMVSVFLCARVSKRSSCTSVAGMLRGVMSD